MINFYRNSGILVFLVYLFLFQHINNSIANILRSDNLGSTIGINIHGIEDRDIDLMWEAGIRIVRLDLTWQLIEEKKGLFDFEFMDKKIDKINNKGFKLHIILAYSNKNYTSQVDFYEKGKLVKRNAPPTTPASIDAFRKFSVEAVSRYKQFDPIWEIWNEPDTDGFWPPSPNVDEYINLADKTCQSMRQIDSHAIIVAPGVANTPRWMKPSPKFLQAVLHSPLVDCLSAISVHPYLHISQLDWTPSFWAELRQMAAKKPNARLGESQLPFISSESGLSTYRAGITDETQASYLAKMLLLNASSRIPVSIIYDWRDDGDDPHNPEHRYGITRRDGTPKLSYSAIKWLAQEMGDMHFVCRFDLRDTIGLVFESKSDGSVVLAAWPRPGLVEWSAQPTDFISVNQSLPPIISATDMLGKSIKVTSTPIGTTFGPGLPPFYLKMSHFDKMNKECKQNYTQTYKS